MATLIHNLSQLATPRGFSAARGRSMREISVIDDPVIVVEDGVFSFVGRETDLPRRIRDGVQSDFDAAGATALPGFVDTHTHLPFAGYRESEFNRRLHGESYEQIAAAGGGIASSVRATRSTDRETLTDLVLERTTRMLRYGTTTAEAKSGYGLNVADELKQLEAIRSAGARSKVRLIPTCLAAHDIPPELRGSAGGRAQYVEQLLDQILPAVAAERLAEFCDVFVEKDVFTLEDGRKILTRGKDLGMTPRLHADELSDTGGAALAAEMNAASADHLMCVSESGIAALAGSGTVANLLPGTSFFLMSERFAPARALIDAGAIVSLSTDCNPGSSMTESMQIVVQLACLRMGMTVEEALTAATLNGAFSLGLANEIGSIEVGKRADFFLVDAPSYLHLVYHFGVNLVTQVFRDGVPSWH